MPISDEQLRRYARHIVLPEVGIEGQENLLNAKVLLVGAGGLGSPVALYLAGAGVGTLGIVDFDLVDESNLQRQIIHSTKNIGHLKAESAQERIQSLNPEVKVNLHPFRLTKENVSEVLKDYDIVVDGTDNFPARYLLNDACFFAKKPWVYGSIYKFDGQSSVFNFPNGPCYRCLFPEPPTPEEIPSCMEAGVLGIVPGIIGLIEATETIKLILGKGELLIGKLLLFNAMEMNFRTVTFKRDSECLICGNNPTIKELIDYDGFCNGGHTIDPKLGVSVHDLKEILEKRGSEIVLLDIREPYEYQLGRLPNSKTIPLRVLKDRIDELNPSDEIYIYCQTGGRSARAVEILRSLGFDKAKNLIGGVDAWIPEIDSSLSKHSLSSEFV